MIQRRLTTWLIVFLFCFVAACTGGTGSSQVDATEATAIDSAETEVGTNVGNPNVPSSGDTAVGTNVGNPTTPIKAAVTNSLVFRASPDVAADGTAVQSSDAGESSTDDAASDSDEGVSDAEESGDSHEGVTASSSDCTPIAFDTDQHVAASQECSVTPADYELGILAVYLISCADGAGDASVCQPKDISGITGRATLYYGDQVDVAVTADGVGFPEELAVLSDGTSMSAGGLQVVTAYVGQKFPDAATDPEEAAKVAPYLQGKVFRICTTPEAVGEETMLARCGNAKAKLGDLLVDLDSDGAFGFVNLDTLAEGFAEETPTPPEDYAGFIDWFLTNVEGGAVSLYTSTDYYATAGYFAQMWPFESLVTADDATSNVFDVTVGIADTVSFIDGRAGRSGSGGDACVSALFESECRMGDDDSASVGVYDPYYDSGLTVKAPLPSVAVEQSTESETD